MAERTVSPAVVVRLPDDGAPAVRRTGAFRTARDRRRYRLVVAALAAVGLASTAGILLWGNESEPGSRAFWLIAQMRVGSLAVIALVALCHAFATVSFHTATGNRIITPSIMGFEALYIAVQTTVVFLLGAAGVSAVTGVGPFLGGAYHQMAAPVFKYDKLLKGIKRAIDPNRVSNPPHQIDPDN